MRVWTCLAGVVLTLGVGLLLVLALVLRSRRLVVTATALLASTSPC
jgi:hypothetical protein